MIEVIRILKDVSTTNWVPSSRNRQSRSQLIRPSPRSQIKSRTNKRKILDRFSGHLPAGEDENSNEEASAGTFGNAIMDKS